MIKYIFKRIGIGIASLLLLITVTFFLTRMMPGSPFQSGAVSDQVVEALEQEYGLGRPVLVQYFSYIGNLLQGNAGMSYQRPGISVASIITRAWPVSFAIGFPAVIIALIAGTVLGVMQATTTKPVVSGTIFAWTIMGMAIPNFVIALILMLLLGQVLKWFPVPELAAAARRILPVPALCAGPAAVVTRLVRNGFAAEMDKEYVMFAKAKGLNCRQIGQKHVLPNIWAPVLSYIGPVSAALITGSFAVENVFNIPGLGREFVLAVSSRDYTMIMGLTIFMGAVVIILTLITDILLIITSPQFFKTKNGQGENG